MSPKEANKIIAEYEGATVKECHISYWDGCKDEYLCPLYSESIDATVPALEKLGAAISISPCESGGFYCSISIERHKLRGGVFRTRLVHGETSQAALSIATAEAIKEIGN